MLKKYTDALWEMVRFAEDKDGVRALLMKFQLIFEECDGDVWFRVPVLGGDFLVGERNGVLYIDFTPEVDGLGLYWGLPA